MTKRTTIRQLKHGDPMPAGEPRRYANRDGYIRLRWKVGPYAYVEAYEHRVVAGLDAPAVHHRNRQTGDNSPDNLAAVTHLDHAAEHSRIDAPEAAALYAEGWSLIRLAKRYGVGNPTIMRFLKRRGVKMRSLSEAWQFRPRATA